MQKKFANLKNAKYFCKIKLFFKICAKISTRIIINYSILKALDLANSNMQKHFQNFEKLNVFLRKIENVQIFFKGVRAQINAKFVG